MKKMYVIAKIFFSVAFTLFSCVHYSVVKDHSFASCKLSKQPINMLSVRTPVDI